MIRDDFLWCEKYRPRTIADTVLPLDLKTTFSTFVSEGNVPNLLLTGKPGTGKTTVARAMLEELNSDYIIINGSLNGNIDTLRNDILQFASSMSLVGGRKYVILDEADYLNPNSTQPALRNFMEEFSKNCGFILTCNFKNRIIEPLHSRCSVVEFKVLHEEKQKMASQFFNRVVSILGEENIEYDKKVVAEVVAKYFPDFRRTLNELQRYSVTGTIDNGILAVVQETSIKELVQLMKNKDFSHMRKWVGENTDIDATVLFRKFYDQASAYFKTSSIPQMVLIIADYQYKHAFVADPEINIVAFLTEVMIECEFK